MSIDYSGMPFAKPAADPNKRTRTHLRRMKAMRDAVWERDGIQLADDQAAACSECGAPVFRRRCRFGEVHHIQPRSTNPSEKYDPANAVILCRNCHERAS